MRRLIIKRKNSMVGCLMKVKVFISDKSGESGSLWGAWRELGKMKNNSELVTLIDDKEHKVMVDNLFKDAVEFVPAGEEDVVLRIKCKFSPFIFPQIDCH